jgi:hypothetical protein
MRKKCFIFAGLALFCLCGFASGQRQLDNDEVLQILRVLTDQPRDTWIPNGVIRADHIEYRASNGIIIESTDTVKYDGNRFSWEININSYGTEAEQLKGELLRDDIDMNWNERRVFVWDGQKYTIYFRPGNHAIVFEDTSNMPVSVNGPLTAGLVPWGHGAYTYEKLSAAQSSAVEVEEDGNKEVHLTISMAGKPEMVFVLDPVKAYAVLSNTVRHVGLSATVKTYSNYKLISGRWTPDTIEIERHDDSKQSPELLSYDHWNVTFISMSISDPLPFSVDYESNALVEHYTAISKRPLSYYFSDEIDTESLRQERVKVAAAQKTQTQNCATVAIQYVMSKLGKEANQQRLAALVNETDKTTNLDTMKQFLSGLDLHCLAVKTDLGMLKNLTNCYAILHLPGENHFVVLDHIDKQSVWLIDLDRDKFYFPIPTDMFGVDWPEGTALLISKDSIILPGDIKEISDNDLRQIVGADEFGTYSCSELIQEYDIEFCSDIYMGLCSGRYRMYYERYGCELNEIGGSCGGTGIVGNVYAHCEEDPLYPGECTTDSEWISQNIRACQ